MIKVTKVSDERVDMDVSGGVDADAMREGLDRLIEASDGMEHGVMLFRMVGFSMPTFGALSVELQRLPELFRLIGRFDRFAVLTDQAWARAMAEGQGALIPGVEVKGFTLSEEAAAEDWLERE